MLTHFVTEELLTVAGKVNQSFDLFDVTFIVDFLNEGTWFFETVYLAGFLVSTLGIVVDDRHT